VPAQFLVRDQGLFASRGGPSLGVALFIIGAVCLVAALVRPVAFLALPGGIGAVVLAIWYAVRLRSFSNSTFGDIVGVGTVVAIVGGVVAVIGGILALTRALIAPTFLVRRRVGVSTLRAAEHTKRAKESRWPSTPRPTSCRPKGSRLGPGPTAPFHRLRTWIPVST
jgi:hypothetical protein